MSRFDDLSDSKEGRRRRQQKRRDALKAAAQRAGFESWYKLETAVINGQFTIGDETMSRKNLLQRVKELVKTNPYPHNETNIEEWIDEGDCDDMTAEEIAAEWDEANSQD